MTTAGRLRRYAKAALLYHWNLLVLGAAVGFGALLGELDVVLPLTVAAELVYLSALTFTPRFQSLVDAREASAAGASRAKSSADSVRQMLSRIGAKDRAAFERLRALCAELGTAARGVTGEAVAEESGARRSRVRSLDRLLWIYLRLLYSKHSLESFFAASSRQEIEASIRRARERIAALGPEAEDTPERARLRASLADTLGTSAERLENHAALERHRELVLLEIERLGAKIAGIAELGVGRQRADALSGEIDVVYSSAARAESTMRDLERMTGSSLGEEEAPRLLDPAGEARG